MSIDYRTQGKNKKVVTLIMTEKCNLNCIYCYEHNKTARSMSLDMAKKIIDKEFEVDDGFQCVEVDFFGGEPLLEFDKIVDLVEYVKKQSYKKPYEFFVVTNGTLVHGRIKEWLIEHPEVVCGLSLDGNKKIQDMNRSNSFDDIDIDFFKKMYPLQEIKMTVSKESLPYFSDGVIFCHEKGFKVSCNLACGIDWSDEISQQILSEQLMVLINYYMQHPEITPCNMLGRDIRYIGYDNVMDKAGVRKWCGTGTAMPTYGIDGTKYPCQYFSPMTLGEELAKKAKELTFITEIPADLLDSDCVQCPIKEICPTCYGENFAATGNMYKPDKARCKLNKITMKARAYFKALQWESGLLNDLSSDDEQALLRAIMLIQNMSE